MMSPEQPPTEETVAEDASGVPWLTAVACLLCGSIFAGIQWAGGEADVLGAWGAPGGDRIRDGALWALVSSSFVHLEPIHLLFNVVWLWELGRPTERAVGSGLLLVLILASSVVGSGFQLAASGETGIGASGVVYALVGFMWAGRARYPSFAAALTPKTYGILLLWLVGCFVATHMGVWNVANGAHVGGLFVGLAAGGGLAAAPEKRLACWGAVGVLVVAGVVPVFWAPWSPSWLHHEANKAYLRGENEVALAGFSAALERDQERPFTFYMRGVVRAALGDLEGAVDDTSEYIRVIPSVGAVYAVRASYKSALGQQHEALADYDEALRLSADPAMVHANRALILVSLHEYTKAIAASDEALALTPNDPSALQTRATARKNSGDPRAAIEDLDLLLEGNPDNFGYVSRAWCWIVLGETSRARSDCLQAAKTGEPTSWSEHQFGMVEALAKDQEQALGHLRKASELDPDYAYPRFWIAGLGGGTEGLEGVADGEGWEAKLAQYAMGSLTADELLTAARSTEDDRTLREQLCEAHGYIGLHQDQGGDLSAASDSYQACVATRIRNYIEFDWAQARLSQLKAR